MFSQLTQFLSIDLIFDPVDCVIISGVLWGLLLLINHWPKGILRLWLQCYSKVKSNIDPGSRSNISDLAFLTPFKHAIQECNLQKHHCQWDIESICGSIKQESWKTLRHFLLDLEVWKWVCVGGGLRVQVVDESIYQGSVCTILFFFECGIELHL